MYSFTIYDGFFTMSIYLVYVSLAILLALFLLEPQTVFVSASSSDKTYYNVLGVDKKADISEIKKSYRKLAKVYHPDKNKGKSEKKQKENSEKFMEVSKAYETLSDEQLRREYDESLDPRSYRHFHNNHVQDEGFYDEGGEVQYVRGPNGEIYAFYAGGGGGGGGGRGGRGGRGGQQRQGNNRRSRGQDQFDHFNFHQFHQEFYQEPPFWYQILQFFLSLASSVAPILILLCIISLIDLSPRRAPPRRLDE